MTDEKMKVHKARWAGYLAECGEKQTFWRKGVIRETWRGVTCGRCLRIGRRA